MAAAPATARSAHGLVVAGWRAVLGPGAHGHGLSGRRAQVDNPFSIFGEGDGLHGYSPPLATVFISFQICNIVVCELAPIGGRFPNNQLRTSFSTNLDET